MCITIAMRGTWPTQILEVGQMKALIYKFLRSATKLHVLE
ncbi:hypothetical protein PVAP13_8NG006800 [Panicum virgatum]|uniref:Uncharacterized protein n=1 Tax=Panicum virgatum TaxID=38727 RepID=A0A8T0P470_PANVG|nr:hypothetical protein PVAP13_8NG006800 [Panicum virgatum]